ncbi:MAG: peptide chain release factor N(5)-glutamine methyltransferase [Oleiphilus sp.]|nr:MAG: peptide chain release factor N(5)-glutamine methyltransferase [Oleiphilus sp.]
MTSIQALLNLAKTLPGENPGLDMQLLLTEVLACDRSYLHTWPEKTLSEEQLLRIQAMLDARRAGEPIAHILGHQSFWTLDLKVSPATLIPRQDTELLVEQALALDLPENVRVLDLGTGTGAIALALASERPDWQVLGVDFKQEIIALARENADRNQLSHVRFEQSDWFSSIKPHDFDLIVSNPPYIDPQDHHLGEGDLRFEAPSALVSGDEGLADINTIVAGACAFLVPRGWLMLEHGYDQGEAVRSVLQRYGYHDVKTYRDLMNHERVACGRFGPE